MMNCREYADLLGLYAGGDLDREEEGAVRTHVNACAECAREVEDFRLTLSALKEIRSAGPAPSLWEPIRRALGTASGPSLRLVVPAWAACAAALAVGLSIGVLLSAVPSESAAPQAPPPTAPSVVVAPDESVWEIPTQEAVGGSAARPGKSLPPGAERRPHLQRVLPLGGRDARRISF
jgi:anti-sigma factor RsiW